jgi:hypothetical protein
LNAHESNRSETSDHSQQPKYQNVPYVVTSDTLSGIVARYIMGIMAELLSVVDMVRIFTSLRFGRVDSCV